MNEAEIMRILSDWNFWGDFREELKGRESYLSRIGNLFSPKTATILLGIRRAGKSSLAYLFVKQLMKKGLIRAEDSMIVNFEKIRGFLLGLRAATCLKSMRHTSRISIPRARWLSWMRCKPSRSGRNS